MPQTRVLCTHWGVGGASPSLLHPQVLHYTSISLALPCLPQHADATDPFQPAAPGPLSAWALMAMGASAVLAVLAALLHRSNATGPALVMMSASGEKEAEAAEDNGPEVRVVVWLGLGPVSVHRPCPTVVATTEHCNVFG